MKVIIKLFFLTFVLLTTLHSKTDYYYGVDEYLKLNNQEGIYNSFKRIVQEKAKPLKTQKTKIKIVMVYPANQISDYWRKSKMSFEKRLQELNISYELIDFFTKPAVEIKEQSKHLLKALKEKPDYLVFTLDANKHKKFVERLISKNKTKIILQNITTPLREWKDRQPFLYVGFDHYIGSKQLADYYIKKTKGKGKYAVLYGSKGYVSYMRGTKFIEYLSSKSHLKLSLEYYTNFNKEKAKNATLDLLKRDEKINFIYACSTDIALGVVEVLKEKNLLGKIMVNGWGGGNEELKAIENKDLDVTIMRMNDENGIAMAEAIKLDLQNKSNEIPTIYSGDFEMVDKNIDKNTLRELENRAFRYTKE